MFYILFNWWINLFKSIPKNFKVCLTKKKTKMNNLNLNLIVFDYPEKLLDTHYIKVLIFYKKHKKTKTK